MVSENLSAPIKFMEFIPEANYELYPVDREIPVLPLTDAGLAALPHSQRLEIINERRFAYAKPELESHFVIPIDEIRPTTLDLASTIVDVKTRDWEIGYYSARLEEGKRAYEAEKAAIRNGKGGKISKDKKVADLAAKWQVKSSDLRTTIEGIETVKNTTIDGFIRSTFLTPGGVDSFLLASQDLEEQSYFLTSDSIELLKQAQERLKTVKDPEAINSLRYKSIPGNLVFRSDVLPLGQVVKHAFAPDQDESNVNIELNKTAREIVEFYFRNIPSIMPKSDKSPRIGIIYDFFAAASVVQSPSKFQELFKYIIDRINFDRDNYQKDLFALRDLFVEESTRLKELIMRSNMYGISISEKEEIKDKLDPKNLGSITGIYIDRLSMMGNFFIYAKSLTGKNILEKIKNDDGSRMAQPLSDDDLSNFKLFQKEKYPEIIEVDQVLILNMDQGTYRDFRNVKIPDQLSDKNSRENFLNSGFVESEGYRLRFHEGYENKEKIKKAIAATAIQSIFFDQAAKSSEALLNLESENIELVDRIRNKNLWFVAEQGDQFSSFKNPELKDSSIKSVAFSPAPDKDGHRVVINTDLYYKEQPINIELVITRDGEINWIDGNKFNEPAWVKQSLANFLLRRLHFITSGALGERGKQSNGEAENGETVTRRSHWRILNSTPDRKITLNSAQARAHAEFVLETYGIDIYEENLRRKLAGTLGDNQVLTFVRAVTGNREPNQLVYREELLDLALLAN